VARRLHGRWLGRRPYAEVHELQQRLHEQRQRGEVPDTVLLLEHEPVVTLGRGAHRANLLASPAALQARGIDVCDTGRGGDVTLHAPGQLVAYPILDLGPDRCDVRRYVGDLCETMRRVATHWGVAGGAVSGLIGLWVDTASPAAWPGEQSAARLAKIGAIGVRISRWVTMHGFALNLTTDLSLYEVIVPCGISQHGVSSLQALVGAAPSTREAAPVALDALAAVLGAEVVELREGP
jgi:lipoyl(octanoyl) transferase